MTGQSSIPQPLEDEIDAHEADRHHIPAARVVLERAIVAQMRAIVDGMLAHRLLCGQKLDQRAWVAQFLSRSNPNVADDWGVREPAVGFAARSGLAFAMQALGGTFLANHPPAVEDFKRDFHNRVVKGDITRVAPSDLRRLRIRIFGARVPMWEEGQINSQLARLGSDLRLFVAAADELRAASLLSGLGVALDDPPNPIVFLLGRARACTSLFKAQLFEFDHELAVSPYLHSSSPGLVDQCRIVLRHRFEHGIVQNFPAGSIIGDALAEGTLGHELGHVLDYFGFVLPGHFTSWRSVMRSDLCRFAQSPRKYGEIYVAFHRTFDKFESEPVMALGLLPPDEPKEDLKLIDLLRELVDDELLERTADDKYVCHLFDEGRAWSIE
jgi:hypothetical protein